MRCCQPHKDARRVSYTFATRRTPSGCSAVIKSLSPCPVRVPVGVGRTRLPVYRARSGGNRDENYVYAQVCVCVQRISRVRVCSRRSRCGKSPHKQRVSSLRNFGIVVRARFAKVHYYPIGGSCAAAGEERKKKKVPENTTPPPPPPARDLQPRGRFARINK